MAMEDMSEAEVRLFGPLPPGQAKRHRGGVRAGSGFRLEPLAPSAGCHTRHSLRALECTALLLVLLGTRVPATHHEFLKPCADGTPRTKGTILAHLEPRLAYVPGFLVTFILRVASSFAYSAVKKVRPATSHVGALAPQAGSFVRQAVVTL